VSTSQGKIIRKEAETAYQNESGSLAIKRIKILN
jgi:hypothetical protein